MEQTRKTALITGGATRLGAATARLLHAAGYDIVIHYRNSTDNAEILAAALNSLRERSATILQGDLLEDGIIPGLVEQAAAFNQRLDVLINNASSFYATKMGHVETEQWEDLVGTNMKAPFFLAQAAAPWLTETNGSIVNMVDVHGFRPKKDFAVYSMAKAANAMMVKVLARELGPYVRVNGVAPGIILWPEHGLADEEKNRMLSRTALQRPGSPDDIASTIRFLVTEADYITGQIIAVDGGRMTQQ
ncbi:pteridine reductase [Solemya velum gill symbiont]|uniref:Short-chain alcohol dehydrogenase-like protein n=1 Tax=Solemya velum gill symbiont TaxID=2340 RepID=A0A0B0HFH9_SOVGS|nr:pteridine reductase [Solemya velum gill symbiont]KHF26226.1 short-chain alcohol dehydrogenase-like protein [Solemya velum gill symbiont]OOY38777.1 pteridine reductase [Solemya velum gill symbiont]OOY40706.1 pteridine reductase [Solemya velum gill symbiont]OOY42485.1 pteridine reductase [Solemya velum gill symbiont]OOY43193.1 pteridine reductase [Solemya velum gill symbiont]